MPSAREKRLQELGWRKAKAQFQKELLSSAAGVNRATQQIFVNANNQFLDYVQMNKSSLPYYTGNLHDSIVAVTSQSGRIIRAVYMPKEANRPQHAPYRKRIWGMQEAIQAMRKQTYPRTGVYSTLIVAVPYAEGADEHSRKPGYLEWLESTFAVDMEEAVNVLKYINVNPDTKEVAVKTFPGLFKSANTRFDR